MSAHPLESSTTRMGQFVAFFAVFLPFFGGFAPAATPRPAKPNFVIILSDDCGYNEFSMQGEDRIPTPRIDSIARNGVRFTDGYVSGAVCSPSRAGINTGRYQERFGHEFNIPPAYSEKNGLPLSETMLPTVLHSAGYRTIALGKWHLGYAPQFTPIERGYTDYYGFLQGARSYWPLEKPSRLNQLLHDSEPVRPEQFDYMTDELGRRAAAYIHESKDKPFFVYLAFNATHMPLQATEADLKAAHGDKIAAMTIALDRAVGMVLDQLDKDGLSKNTIVVYLTDNGGPHGHDNSPLRGYKGSTWEGGIRVPFCMQWPGVIPSGQTYRYPIISLDLFATFIAAADVDKSPGKPLDGVDLLPYVTGENKERPHQTLYWKHGSNWAVRDGDMKLVAASDKGSKGDTGEKPMLFDLSKDISETNDLAAARPDDVKRLQKMYDDWHRDFPKPLWGGKHSDDDDSDAK
ncbi:MAG: sulfatase-like hydrolase/transferase [Planctomycetes bacterium]|nr:sulfatase-like hydrolase/transferase [Planctomycetota bacterium]